MLNFLKSIIMSFSPVIIAHAEETPNALDFPSQIANTDVDAAFDIVAIFKEPVDFILKQPIIDKMCSITAALGVLFMLLYFFIDLEEVVLRNEFDSEIFIKNLIRFVIAIAVVLNIRTLFNGLDDFLSAVLKDLAMSDSLNLAPKLSHAKANANFILKSGAASEKTVYHLETAIIWLFQWLFKFALRFLSVKRAIEITLYSVFAPIIFADVFSGNLYGTVQKFKNILAVYLQVPFILLIMSLGNAFIESFALKAGAATLSAIYLVYLVMSTLLKSIISSKDELEKYFSS